MPLVHTKLKTCCEELCVFLGKRRDNKSNSKINQIKTKHRQNQNTKQQLVDILRQASLRQRELRSSVSCFSVTNNHLLMILNGYCLVKDIVLEKYIKVDTLRGSFTSAEPLTCCRVLPPL